MEGKRATEKRKRKPGTGPAENKHGRPGLSPALSCPSLLSSSHRYRPAHCLFRNFPVVLMLVGPRNLALSLYALSCLIFSFCLEGAGGSRPRFRLPASPPLFLPSLPLVRPLPDPPLGQTRTLSQQWTDNKRGKDETRGFTRPANGRLYTTPKHAQPRRYYLLVDNTS